ncbi:hypothetical protein CBS147346_7535 [Aspergillus niger]|nr:hypothetical protein CBS147346_7535 [Aspergillus niger]
MPTTVAIAGLTGKFAQCIASSLQAYPDVFIRGYCRSPQKLPHSLLLARNIKVIKGEIDDRVAARLFVKGANVVICCYFGSSAVMVQGQKVLIDACEELNVPRYIASDFAVDYTNIPANAIFPKDSARIIREYLASKRTVAGVHILTGGLMETFWSEFFGCWDRTTRSLSFWGTGEETWDLTTYETAAAYTPAVALDKSAVGVLRFRGDRKTILEIKDCFEKVYTAPLNLVSLGSIEELHTTVLDSFRKNPSDVMSWAPKQNQLVQNSRSPLLDKIVSFTACQPDSMETKQFINRFSSWISQRYQQRCLDTEPLPGLVQFNITRSLVINAQILGYTSERMAPSARSSLTSLNISKSYFHALPASLQPTALQRSVHHHPWIDLLPVAELRDNLLRQPETTYDAAQLCRDMRGLQVVSSGRGGVIVWGEPWDPHGWEVTEAFVQKWPWVVRGSRSLLQSTNYWRAQRGEPALSFQNYPAANGGANPRVHEVEEHLGSPA